MLMSFWCCLHITKTFIRVNMHILGHVRLYTSFVIDIWKCVNKCFITPCIILIVVDSPNCPFWYSIFHFNFKLFSAQMFVRLKNLCSYCQLRISENRRSYYFHLFQMSICMFCFVYISIYCWLSNMKVKIIKTIRYNFYTGWLFGKFLWWISVIGELLRLLTKVEWLYVTWSMLIVKTPLRFIFLNGINRYVDVLEDICRLIHRCRIHRYVKTV